MPEAAEHGSPTGWLRSRAAVQGRDPRAGSLGPEARVRLVVPPRRDPAPLAFGAAAVHGAEDAPFPEVSTEINQPLRAAQTSHLLLHAIDAQGGGRRANCAPSSAARPVPVARPPVLSPRPGTPPAPAVMLRPSRVSRHCLAMAKVPRAKVPNCIAVKPPSQSASDAT
jgi:hypothetical protein